MEDFQHSRSNSPTITLVAANNKIPSRSTTPSRLVFEPIREPVITVVTQPVQLPSPSSEETSFIGSEKNSNIQTV